MALQKGMWWALPIALVLLFALWNPVGYGGGYGSDDNRYLIAARCWLSASPCLPTNHWEGRWPVIAPLAASFGLFDISRLSIGSPYLLASGVCLLVLGWLGNRHLSPPVGLGAALIFGLVPAFAIQAYSATVEPIETAFILGCFAFQSLRRPILAGLCLGLAFQTRETAIAALIPVLLLIGRDRDQLFRFLLAFAMPLAAEFLYYFMSTGNPIYRRTLSIEHTLIPSTELLAIDTGSPFFNANIIANWNHEPGLHIHWLVDGFANLLINLKTGLLFVITPLLFLIYRGRLKAQEQKIAWYILASSFFYASVLIYGLSVDPKPRMMYVPLAGLSLVLGLVAVRAWNLVIGSTFAVVVLLSALCLAAQPRHLDWEKAAERINARFPGQIETSQAGFFAIHPVLRSLPTTGSGKPYLLLVRDQACQVASSMDPFDVSKMTVVAGEGSNPIAVAFGYKWKLCLFRYPERFKPPVLPRVEDRLPKRI